ncbi:MAG: septal ring lytic transglycosylase RlpA family protein [Deltaproteobacteria bacterium]|nr:septal ring lytic transglycosylase RlpA family protein [Candidatus Anaeroferrophillus wilburensis]MBN2889641.1 septal ring lytic transglycosylase RlpA family protein [Deltaproteobacteria bacterium]
MKPRGKNQACGFCRRSRSHRPAYLGIAAGLLLVILLWVACSPVRTTYQVTKGTVKTTWKALDLATDLTGGTVRTVYKIGKFTFDVVMAPDYWPMTQDLETIDGLSPKEAIRQGRVKNSPYSIHGQRYAPMSVAASQTYCEEGVASWYGYETRRQKGGHMTANGEAFDPLKPTAAHKLLPLPIHVRVTNLENGRSMIVRVNDRGPFVAGRIIDLSAGASRELGFYDQGTARVRVETVELN